VTKETVVGRSRPVNLSKPGGGDQSFNYVVWVNDVQQDSCNIGAFVLYLM